MKKKQRKKLGLYQKFALLMIVVALIPMTILTTFIANQMIENYQQSLRKQYDQAAEYLVYGIEELIESYNGILKLTYYYDTPSDGAIRALSFDHFREMLYGENYQDEFREEKREEAMNAFLRYVANIDTDIYAVHFIGATPQDGELDFHYSNYSTWFRNEADFRKQINHENLDTQSNQLILIPTHSYSYYGSNSDQVITLGRNYFDLRGEIGTRSYVGTLFIDIELKRLAKMIKSADFGNGESIYLTDQNGNCYYSTDSTQTGKNIQSFLEQSTAKREVTVIQKTAKEFGLNVIVLMDTVAAFSSIRAIRNMMYFVLFCATLLVILGAFYFSGRLVKPVREMIQQMKAIEQGNFDVELPVKSDDEIGQLSRRFNQMSLELKNYINQSYLLKIRQTEAELTALKSQIYPHFLYNTLEIIRMTALEEGNKNVPIMIEALSAQIHYLIGPSQDMVALTKEVEIVRKYVYLLNCRISGKVQLVVSLPENKEIQVPRLILQPVVENAYVHGIKPKKGGSIFIEAKEEDETLEITVMDNGVGMEADKLQELRKLLEGSDPGIKNQDDWQSIGLKNVHDRIQFQYGEEYGIDLSSTPGIGTVVHLLMPLQRKGDMTDENDTCR